jgi:hypothetical protein
MPAARCLTKRVCTVNWLDYRQKPEVDLSEGFFVPIKNTITALLDDFAVFPNHKGFPNS